MTTIPATLAAVAAGRLSAALDRAGVRPPCGRSQDGTGLSQGRNGWPLIQSHMIGGELSRAMMRAMHELPEHTRTNWSADTSGYKSTYRASYTVVYTKAREVS